MVDNRAGTVEERFGNHALHKSRRGCPETGA